MRIIEEGSIPNIEYVFTCRHCKCVFAVTEFELYSTPYINKSSYRCPTCGTQVYGYITQEVEEEETPTTESDEVDES